MVKRDHINGPFEYCAVSENIHTLPTDQKGLEFPGGRGFCKAKSLKKCMKLKWNFQRGGVLEKIFWNYMLLSWYHP